MLCNNNRCLTAYFTALHVTSAQASATIYWLSTAPLCLLTWTVWNSLPCDRHMSAVGLAISCEGIWEWIVCLVLALHCECIRRVVQNKAEVISVYVYFCADRVRNAMAVSVLLDKLCKKNKLWRNSENAVIIDMVLKLLCFMPQCETHYIVLQ